MSVGSADYEQWPAYAHMQIHHQGVGVYLAGARPDDEGQHLTGITYTIERTCFETLKLGDLMRGTREAAEYCVWA